MFTNYLAGNRYFIGFKTLKPLSIQPGSAGELSTRMYIGPKEIRRLKKAAPGLDLTVDYGWLTPISSPLYWLLDKIHIVVGNWGWAIIILTMLIKLAFFPLSAASYKSMANMRRMTPRIKTLKERYGDDKQKLNQAMMKLYKEEKINPLGGCLPVLIQIPVFIALYWALLESVELRQAPWIFWIRDLSAPDPYFVLPILMGASMLGQQMLSAVAMDPLQKKIMMAMPIVFTFFFLFFPSGLVLYWTVNNLLTIAQQYTINKKMGV
ncbi:membrane protein insertase YidC [bacterium BMS3Bbin11]|nr:membrane protein insertase YidC [bacterium BMS3Bbin11]